LGIFFHVLVCCAKTNLATLVHSCKCSDGRLAPGTERQRDTRCTAIIFMVPEIARLNFLLRTKTKSGAQMLDEIRFISNIPWPPSLSAHAHPAPPPSLPAHAHPAPPPSLSLMLRSYRRLLNNWTIKVRWKLCKL
jgi:hypothetical protein